MRRKTFYFIFSFCLLLFSVSLGNWQVAPSADTYEYSPGDSFVVALTIGGDGNTIDAMGFDLTYPGTLLNFRRAYFEGTVLEPWMFKQAQLLSDGVLRIAGFTTTGQINSGTTGKLVNVVFEVEPSVSGEGYIFPNSFTDDLVDAVGDSALFRVPSAGFSVTGYVRYYNNLFPVPGVSAVLANFISSTNSSGEFSFSQIPAGNYVIKPAKIDNTGGSISPFDAAKILQYAVGLIELNPYQLIAGDVSGNGSVSPFDASYILQYSVGLIESFPVGRDWFFLPFLYSLNETNWNSAPDSIELKPLDRDTTGVDFKAIVLGDVTGNWSGGLKKQAPVQVRYQLESPGMISESKIGIPLILNFSDETFAGQIEMHYTATDFKFSEAVIGGNRGNLLFKAGAKSGNIDVAFASAYSLKNQPVKVMLIFEKKSSHAGGYPQIEISTAIINESRAQLIGANENAQPVPSSFRLEQNYPNPFNPETTIQFFLAGQEKVLLQVFNTKGQRIRTLISGKMGTGEHHVVWDGLDEKGQTVASGVYFYQLNAGDFRAVKKMLFIR
ncbi:MAG: T9SS type A sorting domain-containing protein [Calditrichaeota bacterium]|nr:T9SS type A sorting domain-containing protein [Calditrichota bacterium]